MISLAQACSRRMGGAGMRRGLRGGGGGGAAPYTPASEPDLVAWFDPTSGVTMDGANRVSAWTSRVNAHALFQLSSPSQPLFEAAGLLSQPALYFDGTRFMSTLTAALANALDGTQPMTVVAVVDRNDALPAGRSDAIWGLADSGSSQNAVIVRANQSTGADFHLRGDSSGQNNTASTAADGGAPARWTCVYAAASTNTWIGSAASIVAFSTPKVPVCDQFMIGVQRFSGSNNNFLHGRIADVIALNTARTAASLANLWAYLDAKYPGL